MQGNDWLQSRCGHATSSRFGDALAINKNGKVSERRKTYMLEIISQRLTNEVQSFSSSATSWGHDQESEAALEYAIRTGRSIDECEFIKHSSIDWVGGSPDGLIEKDGITEIKCPFNTSNHIETIANGMPKKHMPQVQGNMWVTGRQYCDFVSYDPRIIDKDIAFYCQRIERDDKYIADMEEKIISFLEETEQYIENLHKRRIA